MSIIIGVNAYHGDSAACLVRDGKLVAAAEEERFRRVKHWAGFPSESIRYCLAEAGLTLADVDHIALNQDTSANLVRKITYAALKRPSLSLISDRIRNKRERLGVAEQLDATLGKGFKGRVHQVEHHLAHLSSAFHVSPFEEAAVVSVDGFGDFASAAWGYGRGSEISIDDKVYFPHSLGIFYEALTKWLGFPHYGDEYKVMGLAPYGAPDHLDAMRKIVLLQDDGSFKLDLAFFRHATEKVSYEWENGAPVSASNLFTPALEGLLGPARQPGTELTQRHKDIARSVQAMYEEAFFHLLAAVHAKHGGTRICIAGGCGMNSVANGKIYSRSPFREAYIQSAAGDAGGAIGAAFAVWHEAGGSRDFVMDHAYWGPHATPDELQTLVEAQRTAIEAAGCTITHVADEAALCTRTATAIAAGKVIGWFQGRMEWGPRALGNRSILGDPRRADMKDFLNLKIKRRESFRPFAPSVLAEAVPDWFTETDDVPFMMQVYPIRPERQASIPAVCHVDGSGRLQTVRAETNPRYHRLISAFEAQTGVPMLLNTSFNENEPVVCQPQEALDCFLRTRMDVLVLGDWLIERHESPA
ncbi:carbamoyltransferase [Polymorphobacter multimanifer]|uniref:Carbamoyltransferase n=1 Tax=Polymorphobacter multimanifer TaxID=1070431 RepID=A0A841L5H6_9SPHN|nr:carbamoyltransferase C-terminal domain-containing protein [Polymorphobacter multimanifer]MBB6226223.1 carbamoyltransferase [Polymorphobacter multimanifer]